MTIAAKKVTCQAGNCYGIAATEHIKVTYGGQGAEVQSMMVCEPCMKKIETDCTRRGYSFLRIRKSGNA